MQHTLNQNFERKVAKITTFLNTEEQMPAVHTHDFIHLFEFSRSSHEVISFVHLYLFRTNEHRKNAVSKGHFQNNKVVQQSAEAFLKALIIHKHVKYNTEHPRHIVKTKTYVGNRHFPSQAR